MAYGKILTLIAFILVCIGAIIAIDNYLNRQGRKRELQWRRDRFDRMKEGKEEPNQSIQWLNQRLLDEKSNSDHNFTIFRNITLQELGITYEEYTEAAKLYLRLWWEQLNVLTPTIKQACDGILPLNRGITELQRWMQIHQITQEDLGQDVVSTRSSYMDRCCQVLEKGLYHYPDKPWLELPAETLMQALLDHWKNPELEQIVKWQDWVAAAKKRHANRLLVRLRLGRYSFPNSDQQVNHLLKFLRQATATPEDIDTSAAELEELRGFLIRPKNRQS